MKLRSLFTFVLVCLASSVFAQEPVRDQARCYTTWDEAYFYLAVRVDSPEVQGTHAAPNADVAGDDMVSVFIESDNKHSPTISPNCFSMTVSAAGGAQFRVGTESGALDAIPVYTFKYGTSVQGTLNNSDDIDLGYTIEMAIPWDVMKMTRPAIGDMVSFNIVIRRGGAKSGEFVSLSSRVKTEQNALTPANWVKLVFAAYSFGAATTSLDKIVSAKYVVRPPLVNGIISDKEWHANTSFTIDMPVPEGFVYETKFPVQKMAFTHYFYWYQADKRKAVPLSHITGTDGAVQLQDFPAKNAGPWFSYDRVQWHKEELSDISAAGIDVVLPVYRGDKASRTGFAAKGLDCMVSALEELRTEGKPYPLVAMFFDTTAMMLAYDSNKPDLKDDEVKRAFYGMIRDFYQRIPPEFRALAQTGKPNAGRPANIIFLYTSAHFSDLDSSFPDYCNKRFEEDFGRPLMWVASADFKTKAQSFDGISSYGAGLEANYDNSSRIHIGAIGAGFDDSAVAADRPARIRSRMGGDTYERDWMEMLAKDPHWIVCDSWNDLHEGSDLCASREYGRKYIDATRANVQRFIKSKDFDAQYLRYNVPNMIPPKQFAQAEFVIRNIGASPWRTSDGYALAYRWYKSGRYHGESKVRRPLERDVFPGDTIALSVGIATVNAQGSPIPDGDCEIRFELIRLSDGKWFSAIGDQPLVVPITIGQPPEWNATYLSCDCPVMLTSNQSYDAVLRVRNDGTQIWPNGITKLGCRLFKVASYTHDNPADLADEVPIRDVSGLLAKDCKPGEIAQFRLDLNLAQPDRKPLPLLQQDESRSYQLRFDIYNGEKWLAELGARPLCRIIGIFGSDYGPKIVDCDLPKKLGAGQSYKAKVVVRNNGVHLWDKKRVKLGYHWYHLDGTEMLWEGVKSPIAANIQPGWPAIVTASVKAPDYDGQYVLVWDMLVDDKWLSTDPLSRGGDILPVFVEITNGKLAFADLSALYDTSAMSADTDRTAGDFDGKGSSFPAEYMPPDAGTVENGQHVFPSGYNWDRADTPEGRISFHYPDKVAGTKSAIECDGQKVIVKQGNYKVLHILGASSGGDAAGELSLNYTDGAQTAALKMSDWSSDPTHGEKIANMTRHRHSHGGDEIGKLCYLYHYTVPLDTARVLTSVTLPKNAAMKVVAVTLEHVTLPPPLAVEADKGDKK